MAGIYDPSEYDLTMDMWSYSDGTKVINLINKIQKINLSEDAKEILDISLLTNAYSPKQNITQDQFLKIKSDWLIRQKNLDLIKNYLLKNKNLQKKSDLIKFYVNEHLSRGNISSACEIFQNLNEKMNDNYLIKFNIYCLFNDKKVEEAQLQLDLSKELGFNDQFFEKKFLHLMGYSKDKKNEISKKSLLNFHLSHRTNSEFQFEPKDSTSKLIWRYLSAFNLLEAVDSIDLKDQEKILTIEKATNDGNYDEIDLFNLYERFLFNINQLLSVEESYKLLPSFEARALIYQGVLIAKTSEEKLSLLKLLKDLFIKDNISKAFNLELVKHLRTVDENEVSSDYSSFYNFYLNKADLKSRKIKFNNKIIHQSKLLNHFIEEKNNKKNTEKNLDNLLKKTKKNKKYFFSTKDIILLESLKSDGIKISKKYEKLFELDKADIPIDIQLLIKNNESGLVLLRLVEIIGQDKIEDMGSETIYFIIASLNQLNIDKIRNKILLKILPLKV